MKPINPFSMTRVASTRNFLSVGLISILGLVFFLATDLGWAAGDREKKASRPPLRSAKIKLADVELRITKTPKIVGGKESQSGQWPWMAALVYSDQSNNYDGQFGAGTLIHPWWVVTAGHLAEGMLPGDIDVVLGAHNLQTDTSVQRIHVAEIILHPDFKFYTFDSDIALLRLSEPASAIYTNLSLVDEVSLQNPGIMSTVIGWGDTVGVKTNTAYPEYPETLHEVQIPIVDLNYANGTAFYDGTLTTNMLPAGREIGGKDSSIGDSGGPLMVPNVNGQGWLLAGIVSFGRDDLNSGDPGNFGIYTRVLNYRDFIQTYTMPFYGAWETNQHVAGPTRDPDGDGLANLGEYGFDGLPFDASQHGWTRARVVNVNAKTYPVISFRKPVLASDLDYLVDYADALNHWTPMNPASLMVTTNPVAGDPNLEEWTVLGPLAFQDQPQNQGFFRLAVSPARRVVASIRPLRYQQYAQHALTDEDLVYPEAPLRHLKRYQLLDCPVGTPISVTLRSDAFDANLAILNEDTGVVLFQSTNNAAGGLDERINFTPQAGVRYLCYVTSSTSPGTGVFTLAVFPSESGLPKIAVPQTINSTLTTADPLDPNWLSEHQYYIEDYELVGPVGTQVRIDLSSSAFDAYLYLIDRETGQILFVNDDSGPGTDAVLLVTIQPGRSYVVRATSAIEHETGAFVLTTQADTNVATTISPPQNMNGTLRTTDLTDPRYSDIYYINDFDLTGVSDGQTVCLDMVSEDVDAWLVLINLATGAVIVENDDYGEYTDSRLIFTVKPGIQYVVRATTASPQETGNYRLSAHLMESITVPTVLTGMLSVQDNYDPNYSSEYYIDDYRLSGVTNGQRVTVTMSATPTPPATPVDCDLYLLDLNTGAILMENDDYSGTDSRISFVVASGRTYLIRASSALKEQTGVYTLTLE
jgi:hypothetical protein